MLVFIAILTDLWAGLRKARKNGIIRTSYGYKRTVSKMAQYYNLLFALTIIDAMQMSSVWYMETFYDYKFPLFPFITLLGAIGLGFIELKSVYEKAESKVRFDSAAHLVSQVISNKDNIEAISSAVGEYMHKENKKEEEQKDGKC